MYGREGEGKEEKRGQKEEKKEGKERGKEEEREEGAGNFLETSILSTPTC